MKPTKLISLFTALLMCSLILFCCTPSLCDDGEISIYVNGIMLESDAPPVIENSRTLVPLRAIAESIGVTVDWKADTQKITLTSSTDIVILHIGQTTAYKNDTVITLDVPPKISNNRTLVPVRFVGECFGFTVNWDDSSKTVTLISQLPSEGSLSVYVLDVGQADSIFVRFPDGSTMLVDGGNPSDAKNIIKFLKKQNVTKLNYIVGTHPHSDHIGGLPEIITEIDAEKFFMPAVAHDTDVYEELLLTIKNSGSKITTAKSGVTIIAGTHNKMNFSAQIIAPCSDSYEELNNYSAIIMLSFGNRRILLTGDAETVSENELSGDISADVLKVGHHGSNTSTGESFLKKVDPIFALISVGKDNSYDLPKDSILNRLKKHGCTVFRTDEDGTIAVVTDGNLLTVSPFSDELASSVDSKAPTEVTGNMKVYIPKNGNKYHYRDCSGLNQSSYITEITLNEARAQGRVPCKNCNPPV